MKIVPGKGITTLKSYSDGLFWLGFNAGRLDNPKTPESSKPRIQQTIDILKAQTDRFLESRVHIKWKDFINILNYRDDCKKYFARMYGDDDWDAATDEDLKDGMDYIFTRGLLPL